MEHRKGTPDPVIMSPAITITPVTPPGKPPAQAAPSMPSSARSRSEQLKASAATFPICLVTGGAGYIGSHTVLELLTAGFAVVVIDNLCNSHLESLCRVHYIARTEFEKCGEASRPVPPILFHKVDIRDAQAMHDVFAFWSDSKAILDPEKLPIDVAAMVAKKAYPMLDYTIDTKKRTQPSPLLTKLDAHGKIACVIHFAALKAVGESLSLPLEYYETNVAGLLILLRAMRTHRIHTLIFSSSAVVYGTGHGEAISEEAVHTAGQGNGGGLLTNPYGRTKWMSEEIINDFCVATPFFHATSLRYFNPTGAHASGLIGENPKGTPNNIVPVILQAYARRRSRVHVFGSSYDTPDGTGVRDYIHVADLAKGHLAALRKAVLDQSELLASHHPSSSGRPRTGSADRGKPPPPGHHHHPHQSHSHPQPQHPVPPGALYHVYNLGTGRGYSVLELLHAFSQAAGTDVPYAVGAARAGDLGTVTASPEKAATELAWTAEFDLQDMCRDVYQWAAANPGGYETLRRLSVLSGLSGSQLRRASIASHLLGSEEEFESFVGGGGSAVSAASSSSPFHQIHGHGHSHSHGGQGSPRKLSTVATGTGTGYYHGGSHHRASVASITSLLARSRMSVSSTSSDEDRLGPVINHSPTSSSLAGSSDLGGHSPVSPMNGGGGGGGGAGWKQPRFVMNWSATARDGASVHTELQPPIEEE